MWSTRELPCLMSFFCTWVALAAIAPSISADFNQTLDLYRLLFEGVDTRVRPTINTSAPTEVYVDLNLLSLREIEQTEQYFVINAWLGMSWQDEVRSWDPKQHGGVRFVYPGTSGTWKPNVIVTNSIEDRDVFADDPSPLTLAWDGTARWYPGTVFYLSCTMDLTYFPFDRQHCWIRFLAQEYGTDVNLIPARNVVNTNGYGGHGEWDLESTSVESFTVVLGDISFSRLTYHFDFRRHPAFYILNVLVPVVLMSLLTPLVFVLPEESGERVSYSVTLLLSLSVFMGIVAGHLPQSSEPLPITIVYLFVLLIHSGMCAVCAVIHLKWEQWKGKPRHADLLQQHDRQGQNGHVATGAFMITGESKEEIQSDRSSVSKCSSFQVLYNANSVLIIIFYVSWFAVSGYFLMRLLFSDS